MPSYHFKTTEPGLAATSVEQSFQDLPEARKEATELAGEMLRETQGSIFSDELIVEVSDETGLTMFVIIVTGINAPGAFSESRLEKTAP